MYIGSPRTAQVDYVMVGPRAGPWPIRPERRSAQFEVFYHFHDLQHRLIPLRRIRMGALLDNLAERSEVRNEPIDALKMYVSTKPTT